MKVQIIDSGRQYSTHPAIKEKYGTLYDSPELENGDICHVIEQIEIRSAGVLKPAYVVVLPNGKGVSCIHSEGAVEVSDIKIGNHTVEFYKNHIRVGCTPVPNEIVNQIYNRLNRDNQ